MPRKIDFITELYKRTVKDMSSDNVSWRAFLRSMSYQYKYPFSDQVLIYAQRPLATACATFDDWHRLFERRIRAGAMGIALIKEKRGRHTLEYVFDRADTYNRAGEKQQLWAVKPEYEEAVIKALEARCGDLNRKGNLQDATMCACMNLCDDNIQDYVQELFGCVEGSLLDELDDYNLRARLLITVQAGVAYATFARLGYDADKIVGGDSFLWVHEFNTPATVNVLGTATSDITELCLRVVERAVRQSEKEEKNRTFDTQDKAVYNVVENKIDGGKEYETDLQDGERDTLSQSDTSRTEGAVSRKIRNDEEDISQTASQSDLYDTSVGVQADGASVRDRADSEHDDGAAYVRDGTEPWGNGGAESQGSDGVGTSDEQHSQLSGGSGAQTTDIRITDDSLPPPDGDIMLIAIRHGDYLQRSKEDIVSFLLSEKNEDKQNEYIKSSYKMGLFGEFTIPDTNKYMGYHVMEEGLLIYKGNFLTHTHEALISWRTLRELIEALIKDGNYLDEPEKVNVPANENSMDTEYNLSLGTSVYIGKDQCEILSLSKERVELFNGTLIPLEMDLDTFIKRVRENPLNDSLLKEPRQDRVPAKVDIANDKAKKQVPKRKKGEINVEFFVKNMESEYERWDFYMNGGGSDPMWSDGCNMNLIRNHIMSYRRQLLELCQNEEQLPEIYHKELPPEMPNDFMAIPDTIREAAKKTLAIYKSNETYQWYKKNAERLSEKQLKKSTIPYVLGYVSGLERAIEEDDLITMRRHRNPERYVESFDRCKKDIEKLLPQIEQDELTDNIFASLMNEDKEALTDDVTDGIERIDVSRGDDIWSRYTHIKEQFPDRLALLRVGDFYELFEQDAVEASDTLELTLTGREVAQRHTRVPMCGFPYHGLDKYVQKLIDKGYKVAIGEEDVILIQSIDELARAKAYIKEYYRREFDDDKDISTDLKDIGLAYTTVGEEELPVEAIADLEEYKLCTYLGDVLVETIQFASLKEMNDNLLCGLDFGGLTEVTNEQIEYYYSQTDTLLPTFNQEEAPKESLPTYNAYSDIPDSEKHNYRIDPSEPLVSGAKEKFKRNVEAIKLLHKLDEENRLATPYEQKVLARYTGWGGLSDVFDEREIATAQAWNSERKELKELLSSAEYEAARESTLTAFYTPPEVITAMYKALENMGFKRGNILEPSCGIGNFMGLVPEGMDAKIYGVEIDSLTGRIARQLYQKNGITIDGFEKTRFPDSFFDVAIGNVPFGNFNVMDKRYDKLHLPIHDYFFAKALDMVRPGGVIAFITSHGTLDKLNSGARKYIAQRAELLGAIHLPDNTFKYAGTRLMSDIIFLQKRDRIIETEPNWVHVGNNEQGMRLNQYFVDNPHMILGDMVWRDGQFGPEPNCKAIEGQNLSERLIEAISHIHAEIPEVDRGDISEDEQSIPADPDVKNYSYTLVDGKVYYRQDSIMTPVSTSVTGENRIKGMIKIRDVVRALIDAQLGDHSDSEIKRLQEILNRKYDEFTAKYGLINSRGNDLVFRDDDSYFLLCSLEILDENKQLKAKADMFTKRTINAQKSIEHVDTASEALALSIGEHAFVDMEYMSSLTGKSEQELFEDLKGVIFLNPLYDENGGREEKYVMADEYLSGNVRAKLSVAKTKAELYPEDFKANVEALQRVQPQDLTATEIGVRLGATWIPEEDIEEFVYQLLEPSEYVKRHIKVKFNSRTAQWAITQKNYDIANIKVNNVYGTHRINAYRIIEETLNLKDVRVFDYDDNDRPILNKKETAIAQGKQDQIKRAFEDWIWSDPERRKRLCELYNEKFNSIRPREYDGSHIKFYGMSPEIELRQHQKNAVARIMYGGNTLLAHVVGAGKTFTMVAAAQESKRLGLCNKSMIVVPNHLIEQWATEYLQLYPSANILVATKNSFEKHNRKKFCARIATGDYDAIIIGHSQFEKIPISNERQAITLQGEIDEITAEISEIKYKMGEELTVKQLEKLKKQLNTRLEKLNDRSRKDDVVTFEELGVDRLFVDEAHFYKNLFVYTKMRNVAGIAQAEAQKSSDLYMKCRYLDEITNGKGVIFATGTPVSNTMVELYTMQRYLQYDELKWRGLSNFDAWASTFGETVTAIELSPDGSGYRAKTRFAKFFNIPELMAMFKQVADVQTADMLKLPVPKANYHICKVPASDIQKDLVQSFAERAEKIHNRMVTSDEDNMLLVTNDGRKAALDQRLINPALPDHYGSKVNACAENIYNTWLETKDKRSAQLMFCDLSTPHGDGKFNVYDDIKNKLIKMGIPPEEIAFIHTANTDTKKKELFSKVRNGQVRILMGSTFKMGAGTNVQQKLIALHDLDCPWRPADLEQRAGRIVRQGNTNPEVHITRYITEGTFDAYMYQLLEAKQKFIAQIMTSKTPVRTAEDIDETALSYAEIKALASGNPLIIEKMQLDADVAKLKLQKSEHLSQRYRLEDKLIKEYPMRISEEKELISAYERDIQTLSENTLQGEEKVFNPMTICGTVYTERADAGKTILALCKQMTTPKPREIGQYRGFRMELGFDTSAQEFFISFVGSLTYKVTLGDNAGGIITRLDNMLGSLDKKLNNCKNVLADLEKQVEDAKIQIAKPFPDEEKLEAMCKRLDELNAELDLDKHENEIVDGAEERHEIIKEKIHVYNECER